jgi:Family of unknown function (DUF6134)
MSLRFAALFLVLASLAAPQAGMAAESRKLVYDVYLSRFGTIGTYTNSVESKGDDTIVTTEARIRVSLAGFTLYQQDATRQETWFDGRLVSFRGMTTTNGRSYELSGAAEGENFVLNSPQGSVLAPASVRIANPWSPEVLRGAVLFTPDRGRLEHVEVSEGLPETLTLDGRGVATRRYEITRDDGEKRYEIWMDDRGTPVKFHLYNRYGTVIFTLAD